MPLYNHNVNNLSGGVSQQPEELRFDNQAESMDNMMVTVAQGLRRRNPTSLLGTLLLDHHANTAMHSYSRGDGLKEYLMTLCEHGLTIYDPDDVTLTPKLVNAVGATNVITSWAGTDWKKDIQFVTVGDTTWILNKSKVVDSNIAAQTEIPHAFYWIKVSYSDGSSDGGTAHGHAYEVTLDGITFRAVYPTLTEWQAWGATDAERASNWGFAYATVAGYKTLDSTTIAGLTFSDSISAAKALSRYIDLNASYTARAEGSIVYMKKTDETAFNFEYGDSWGNQASRGWTDSIAKLADLPSSMDGFTNAEVGTVAITGTDSDQFTNYYLSWEDDHWKEVHGIGMNNVLDQTTMPARLVQVSDNIFELGFVYDWGERIVGDDNTNPIPSFVNRRISNMFFFKNRLGFTSEDNVILSEAGEYYNFFATTAMEILDSDPIDAGIDSNTVSTVKYVNATAGALTLWADNAQFLLSGGEILSPATTRISQTSSYTAHSDIPPMVVDNEILFFNVKGDWLDVLSYNPASLQADKSSAESISAHIPEYIPSSIDTACVASAHNMVFLFSKAEPTKIYVYKYYIHGQERKISAWSTWTFDETIIDIEVLNNRLFMLVGTNEILSLDLEPLPIDQTFLDRGVTAYKSSVVMSRYNVITRQGSMTTREPFYMKSLKVRKKGKVDFVIINEERNNTTVVNNKHLGRRLVVGGNTDKVNVGFSTVYDVGCEIDTISLEGRLEMKSVNV